MSFTTEWTSIIFSDEKKFNLDDSGGFQYYWYCLKKKQQYYCASQNKKRKFDDMAFLLILVVESLVFFKGRQNRKDCIKQLETELLPYGSNYGGENWMHQQDGYSIHITQRIKKLFDDKNVQVLPCQPKV